MIYFVITFHDWAVTKVFPTLWSKYIYADIVHDMLQRLINKLRVQEQVRWELHLILHIFYFIGIDIARQELNILVYTHSMQNTILDSIVY